MAGLAGCLPKVDGSMKIADYDDELLIMILAHDPHGIEDCAEGYVMLSADGVRERLQVPYAQVRRLVSQWLLEAWHDDSTLRLSESGYATARWLTSNRNR